MSVISKEKNFKINEICPTCVDTTNPKYLLIDDMFASGIFINNYNKEMDGGFLDRLISSDVDFEISMFYEKKNSYETVKDLTGYISTAGANIKTSTKNQIDNLVSEINERIAKDERVLVTTLTIRMAEELTDYLKKLDIKVAYLHSEIKTLERMEIIRDLRLGKYDVVVGINLLREGIDIPEVSLIAIMDADKQGFLRSDRSLIQTIGRAARNANGHVIMYADKISEAMEIAIKETKRRREIQEKYNEEHHIIPTTIKKEIRELISNNKEVEEKANKKLSRKEKQELANKIEKEMKEAARNLDFERATELRDILFELKSEI